MKSNQISYLPALLVVLTAAACGPETNSRYGDEYWDPNATKEAFDPVEAPNYSVTYVDNTPDDTSDNDFTAYVEVDFTELSRESRDGIIADYTRGLSEEKNIEELLDTGLSSFTDTEFVYDYESGEDRRLRADIVGDYAIVLDFDVIWPNGNTVSYVFELDFRVPGCYSNYDYYDDYINPILSDNCVNCHKGGDASAAFDLDDGNTTTRRDSFLSKIDDDSLNEGTGTMVAYIFNTNHTGYPTVNSMSETEQALLGDYIRLLRGIFDDADDARDITSDFEFAETDDDSACLARPSTFVVEE